MIRKIVVVASAFGICLAGPSFATQQGSENCGDSVTAEILGVLLASGDLDPDQYEASCRRLQEATPLPPVNASAESTKAAPTWDMSWNNGFNLNRSDDAFKLQFGGRIMLDSGAHWVHDGLENDFDTVNINPKNGSGVEFRRARIFFSGDVYDRAFFKAEYEFAATNDTDNPDFTDVYIGLKKLGPISTVQVGHFKEPLFLQEADSSKNIVFMERGLNSVFYPGRNVGAMLTGDLVDKRVFWQAAAFRVTDDQGYVFQDRGDQTWDAVGRVSVVPLYSENGDTVLHLGAGFLHRELDPSSGNLQFEERPEAHLAQRFVDTEDFPAFRAEVLNLELAYVYGPFSLQSEFTNTWVDGAAGQENVEFRGAYAFVSYFLTGEHRVYELGKGAFGRVKPKANFDPANGDWGAFEVAARYSYLDLVNKDISGGDLWDVTAGLNWYLFPNLRAMLNYIHADVSNRVSTSGAGGPIDGTSDSVLARLQIDF